LIKALSHKKFDVAYAAGKALGEIGDASTTMLLIPTLRSRDYRLVGHYVNALRRIRDPRVVDLLLVELDKTESIDCAMEFAMALGRIGDARAVEPLIAKFKECQGDWLMYYFAYALGKLRDARAVEPLIDALRDYHDNKKFVRATIEALGRIGDARAVEPLILKLTTNNSIRVRWEAVRALGLIGDERAKDPIKALLQDRNYDIREEAREAFKANDWQAESVDPKENVMGDEGIKARCEICLQFKPQDKSKHILRNLKARKPDHSDEYDAVAKLTGMANGTSSDLGACLLQDGKTVNENDLCNHYIHDISKNY